MSNISDEAILSTVLNKHNWTAVFAILNKKSIHMEGYSYSRVAG